MIFIYALIDIREPECYRYIGYTVDPIKRLREHIKEASQRGGTFKRNWIRKIASDGFCPAYVILDECPDALWVDYERFWIWKARREGHPLTNDTEGGDGILGFKFSEGSRERMSLSAKKRLGIPGVKERLSDNGKNSPGRTGQVRGESERSKQSASMKRFWSEHRDKLQGRGATQTRGPDGRFS